MTDEERLEKRASELTEKKLNELLRMQRHGVKLIKALQAIKQWCEAYPGYTRQEIINAIGMITRKALDEP